MKILLIGASGTVGRAVEHELSQGEHEIIRAGRTSGDVHVDITSDESVAALFENVGRVDAIVATTGNLFFGPLEKMTSRDFAIGLQDKLLGQVRLALTGQHYLRGRLDYAHQRYCWPGAHRARGQCHDGQRGAGRFCEGSGVRTETRAAYKCRQPNHAERIARSLRPLLSGI
jgi:NAD(P)-dependent dehydrogenase (short-subunit alcohol dehydrogenase family)